MAQDKVTLFIMPLHVYLLYTEQIFMFSNLTVSRLSNFIVFIQTIQVSCSSSKTVHFYRAMLCIRGTSHGPVSVRLCLSVGPSVTSRSSTKMAKRRITQTTPHDSPGTLVFWRQRSSQNSTGVTPYEGAECRWGGSKSATFDKQPAISRKRYKIDT